jgi:hypothetical protein
VAEQGVGHPAPGRGHGRRVGFEAQQPGRRVLASQEERQVAGAGPDVDHAGARPRSRDREKMGGDAAPEAPARTIPVALVDHHCP